MSPKASLDTLKNRADFLAAASSGKKWVARGFIMQIGKLPAKCELGALRYGLTASAKIGNAVVRNRARRRLRALVREILVPHADTAISYVLIARAATGACPHDELCKELIKALKRFKLWKE